MKRISIKRLLKPIFVFTFGIYLVLQLWLTAGPILVRNAPLETDDAYGYMLKASEIESGCVLQDCTALNDLRLQFTAPTEDLSMAAYRHREFHRVFVIYHPLHSLCLLGLRTIGFTFEQAFAILTLLGKVLIIFAIAFWLRVFWGTGVASISLLLLSPIVFDGQGLHYVVPGNLALGVAFLSWAFIFLNPRRYGILMVFLILIMVSLHPAGKIYSVVTVIAYLVFSKWPFERKALVVGGLSILVILTSFLLPSWVDRPEMRFDPAAFLPESWNYLDALTISFTESFAITRAWADIFGGPILLLSMVLTGVWISSRENINKRIRMGGLLVSISIASIFYTVPFYGALAFERIWVALFIFIVGAVSSSLVALFHTLKHQWKLAAKPARKKRNQQSLLSKNEWRKLIVFFVSLIFIFESVNYFVHWGGIYVRTQRAMVNHYEFTPNPQQPELIFGSSANKTETVLYMNEVGLYYFLMLGGLEHGAIYYPALATTPDLNYWLSERYGHITHLVASNPIYLLPTNSDGAILIKENEELSIIDLSGFDAAGIQLLIGGHHESLTIEVTSGEGSHRSEHVLNIDAGKTQWVNLFEDSVFIDNVTIRIKKTSEVLEIKGIRFSENNHNLWPWDSNVTLIFYGNQTSFSVQISEDILLENLPAFNIDVLDDKGFLILARINN